MTVLKQLRGLFKGNSRSEQEVYESFKKQFVVDSCGNLMYVGKLLQRANDLFPDKTALIAADKTITFKEWYFRALRMSQKLAKSGIQEGDHVLLLFENSLELYVSYFAVLQLGAVVIPVNTFLHEKEFACIINQAQPKIIITSCDLKYKLDAVIDKKLISVVPEIFTEKDVDWTKKVPDIVNSHDYDINIPDRMLNATSVLLFTSGTTGQPKGVMLSSKNIMTNALQGYARFTICCFGKEQERFFCVLPLFHVFAQNTCIWLPAMSGSSVIVVRKIDRKLIVQGLEKKPTVFFGFPALYGLLCLMRNAPLDTIKLFVSGADMLPDKVRAAFGMIYGRKICSGYGLTEASPVVAINYHNQEQATNVVGFPVADLECQIRDKQGKIVEPGSIGMLWIRGDNVMKGYYNAPEATEQVLQNGWLNTGDLASIDARGSIAITGRSKDIIIHKGFNIYPQEIENILMTHPAVFKAAVVGKKEVVSGQIPVAYVALKDHDQGIERVLRELCSSNLAAYKVPRKFICLDDLPMSPTGKVDKKQLNS